MQADTGGEGAGGRGGEKLDHMVSDRYSALYFYSVKTLGHTHLASKAFSMRFVGRFALHISH